MITAYCNSDAGRVITGRGIVPELRLVSAIEPIASRWALKCSVSAV
jgi:hypothetical protein